jgi:hypothetical protein
MHECPQCWSICFCDLDDSNDCRDNGACYHQCPPEDVDGFSAFDEDDEEPASPSARLRVLRERLWCDGSVCGRSPCVCAERAESPTPTKED